MGRVSQNENLDDNQNNSEKKDYEFDFFVSYSFKDHDFANWIADQLKKSGYRVFIASVDIPSGDNFVLSMQRGIIVSERAVLVLSNNYLKSIFSQPEWAVFFKSDPEGLKRKLFPVKIDDCSPEGLLGPIVYADISNLSQKDAKWKILTEAKSVIIGKRQMKYKNPFKK